MRQALDMYADFGFNDVGLNLLPGQMSDDDKLWDIAEKDLSML